MFCIFSVEIMRDEIISEIKHVWNDVEGQSSGHQVWNKVWFKEVIDGSR